MVMKSHHHGTGRLQGRYKPLSVQGVVGVAGPSGRFWCKRATPASLMCVICDNSEIKVFAKCFERLTYGVYLG